MAGGGLAAGGTDAGDGAAAGSSGVPAVAGADSDQAAATSGGADSTATADTTAAAATSTEAEHKEAGCSHSCADDASGGKVAEYGEEQGVPGVCHDVVQEVLDRILQQ